MGKEDECDAAAVLKATGALLPPPPPGTPGPFALSEEGKVEAICESAGLKVVYKQTVFCPMQYRGKEMLYSAFASTAPCAKAALSAGSGEVKKAIVNSAAAFAVADDYYYLENRFTLFFTKKYSHYIID